MTPSKWAKTPSASISRVQPQPPDATVDFGAATCVPMLNRL